MTVDELLSRYANMSEKEMCDLVFAMPREDQLAFINRLAAIATKGMPPLQAALTLVDMLRQATGDAWTISFDYQGNCVLDRQPTPKPKLLN